MYNLLHHLWFILYCRKIDSREKLWTFRSKNKNYIYEYKRSIFINIDIFDLKATYNLPYICIYSKKLSHSFLMPVRKMGSFFHIRPYPVWWLCFQWHMKLLSQASEKSEVISSSIWILLLFILNVHLTHFFPNCFYIYIFIQQPFSLACFIKNIELSLTIFYWYFLLSYRIS